MAKRTYFGAFISYRRVDLVWAHLLRLALAARGIAAYVDVSDMRNGDFTENLRESIEHTPNFICIAAPGWIDRCDDEKDWVRRVVEIAAAARRNIVIVEVPEAPAWRDQLPASMRLLANLTPVRFDLHAIDASIARLAAHLEATKTDADTRLRALDLATQAPAFEDWQLGMLEGWYAPDLAGLNGLPDVLRFPIVAGKPQAVVAFRAACAADPRFTQGLLAKEPTLHVRAVRHLPALPASTDEPPDWVGAGRDGAERSEYFQLLSYGERVKRWNMLGFATSALDLDTCGRVVSFSAVLTTYGENCLTSHLLSYRMQAAFASCADDHAAMDDAAVRDRPHFALQRNAEDSGFRLRLTDGGDLFPLTSVQAVVVFRDDDDDDAWKVVAMSRAGNLATDSNLWQFPPAGGFEIYGREDESETHVRSQFDLRTAIVREFLEEIFGDLDMTSDFVDEQVRSQSGSAGFRQVRNALKAGTVSLHLLGAIVGLASVRTEFSFLIVVKTTDILNLRYQVDVPGIGERGAHWLKGSKEGARLETLRLATIAYHMADRRWHMISATAMKLVADLSRDDASWLRGAYPDFPRIEL